MKFLTYTNNGCTEMCKNLLASAYKCGISKEDFIVACIDNLAFSTMKAYHDNSYLYIDQPFTEYHNYCQSIGNKFKDIVLLKLNIISDYYKQYGEICYVDSDIIFNQDPRQYFQNTKVLLQHEFPNRTICSGFMVFNNDDCSRSFLTTVLDHVDDFRTCSGTDQELINNLLKNKSIPQDCYEILDKNKFLNGMCFLDGRSLKDAVIIHNNCIVGLQNKIDRFKYYNLWYV